MRRVFRGNGKGRMGFNQMTDRKDDVELKAGQAWEIRGDVYWYVGADPTDPKAHVFACGNYTYESWSRSLAPDTAKRVPHLDKPRADKAEPAIDSPCETCHENPEVCADIPSLRHCEKANREPAIDVGDLIRETTKHFRGKSKLIGIIPVIEYIASRNLIRTPREPIEGLLRALMSCAFKTNDGEVIIEDWVYKTLCEAAGRYSEGK